MSLEAYFLFHFFLKVWEALMLIFYMFGAAGVAVLNIRQNRRFENKDIIELQYYVSFRSITWLFHKIVLKQKMVTRDKEHHYIVIKGSIHYVVNLIWRTLKEESDCDRNPRSTLDLSLQTLLPREPHHGLPTPQIHLPGFKFYVNEIIWYELFCIWLISLNIVFVRIIYVVECTNNLFIVTIV